MTSTFAPSWIPNGIQTLDGDELVVVVVDDVFSDSAVTVADLAGSEVGDGRISATASVVREETGWTLFLDDPTTTELVAPALGVWVATDGATDADRKLIFYSEGAQEDGTYEPSWDDGAIFLSFENRAGVVSVTGTAVDNSDPQNPVVNAGTTSRPMSVRTRTVSNVTLAGTYTHNGVALEAGDRVLAAVQTNAEDRLIWVVSEGPWTIAPDSMNLRSGSDVWTSSEGDSFASAYFRITTADPIVVGSTELAWAEFTGGGGGGGDVTSDQVTVLDGPGGDPLATLTEVNLPGLFSRVVTLEEARSDHPWLNPVRVVADGATGAAAGDVIDGITLVAGDRVLRTGNVGTGNQVVVVGSGNAEAAHAYRSGTAVKVGSEGTSYANTEWVLTNPDPVDSTVDVLLWEQFAAGGAGTGDVVGPASVTADRIAVFDGTTGKLIKQASVGVAALAPLASPTFTGTVSGITAAMVGAAPTSRTLAGLDLSADRSASAIKTALSLVKADVGLGSVDNTADTAKPVSTAQQTALDLKADAAVTANRQTSSYTLVLADAGKAVEMNVASANNLTVPLNSSVAYPTGTIIEIGQYGAGQTTVVATGGVTIRSSGGKLKLTGQYSGASLRKIGTDEWWLVGDLTT